MATLARMHVEIGANTRGLTQALDTVQKRVKATGQNLTSMGRTLTTRVSAPIAGIGIAAAKMAGDLETSFAKMEGLVGVQREQLDAWEGQVRTLAVTYGQSATVAADALFFITSAGLEGSDAMDALEASLKASSAGLGDVVTIADLATSAMNAYGPEVLGAAQATDILTAAVREGKLAPEELAGSMGRVLPIASAMGVRFDEVGAAMAAMSRTGTNAAEASTQLRSIMTGLLQPSVQAHEALADMGLTAAGLREQIREQGLLSVLQTLSDRFQGNDEAAASVFGNVRALSGIMDLMGANAQTTATIFQELTETTGATDEAFRAMSETTGFQLNQAMAITKELLITLGNAVLPVVVQVLEQVTASLRPVAAWFEGLDPRIQKVTVVVGALVAGIGPLLVVLGAMVTGLSAVIGVLGAVSAPVMAVVGVLAVLVAAFAGAYAESETFRSIVSAAIDATWKTTKRIVGFMIELWDAFAEAFMGVAEEIVETLEVVWIDPFRDLWEEWGEHIMRFAQHVWETISRVTRTQLEIIVSIVRGAMDVVSNTIQFVLNVVQGDWSEAWENVQNIVRAMKDAVLGIVTALVSGIRDQFGRPLEEIIALANRVKDKVTGAFAAMKDVVVGNSIVPDMVEGVVAEFDRMVGGTADRADTLVGRVTGAFSDLRSGILDPLRDVAPKVAGHLEAVLQALDIDASFGGIDIARSVDKWIDIAITVVDALKTIWNWIKDNGDKVLEFFSNLNTEMTFDTTGSGVQDIRLPGDPTAGLTGTIIPSIGILNQLIAINQTTIGHTKLLTVIQGAILESRDALFSIRDAIANALAGGMGFGAASMMPAPASSSTAAGAPASAPGGGGRIEINFHGPVQGVTEEGLATLIMSRLSGEIDEFLGRRQRSQRSSIGTLRSD